jgi:hypothetical protein
MDDEDRTQRGGLIVLSFLGIAAVVSARFRAGFVTAVLGLALIALPVLGQQNRLPRGVTLHVTDFGINQPWSADMQVGDPFQPGQHVLFALGDKRSQILIPMPSDEDMTMSTAQLSESLAKALLQNVDKKVGEDVAEFEIQLVQHVGPLGYADPTRQAEIKKFGEAAYAALGDLVRHLANERHNVTIDVTAGSNGTVALAAGAREVAVYKDNVSRVDLVDGRASRVATANAIELIGADKFRIINTHGDFSAPPWSIGNYDASRSLKAQFPELTNLLLTPKNGGLAHIQWMLNPNGAFDVVETVVDTHGIGKISLGTFSPVRFRNSTTYRAAHDRAMATKPKSSSEDTLADELDRLAGNIDAVRELVQAIEKIASKDDLLPSTFSLLPATLRDEADKIRYGDRKWLASHKVDAIASECLSRLEDVVNKLIESGTLPSSYVFLSRIDGATIADVASAAGQGRLDVAGLTKLLDDVSKYTASVAVRLLLSPLGPAISNWAADATESFVDMALPVVRTMTAGVFQDLYRNPVRQTILDQWLTAQNRRMANGQQVQDLRQMYGAQVLADAGFSQDFLEQNATDVRWFNSLIGSAPADGKSSTWLLARGTGTAHLVTLGSRSWDTPSETAGRNAPTDSVPATAPDTNACKGDNCVGNIVRKKPDPPSPCVPFSPGCACPPGTPGCGGGSSAGVPPSGCPPDDPNCTSRSPGFAF